MEELVEFISFNEVVLRKRLFSMDKTQKSSKKNDFVYLLIANNPLCIFFPDINKKNEVLIITS